MDHSIFVTQEGSNRPIISTFVDDIKIIALKGNELIDRVKQELTFILLMVDIGLVSFYFSLKVSCNWEKQTIKLCQLTYINKVLNKFHLDKNHIINIPIKEIVFLEQKANGKTSTSEKK